MEWTIIGLLPACVGLIIGYALNGWEGFGSGCVAAMFWQMFIWLLVYDIFSDGYKDWKKDGQPGDCPWYEWRYCLEQWKAVKAGYDPATYCKMPLKRFKAFFSVNPARYDLRPGYAVCDDGRPQDLIVLFPRRDVFGYYRFRRYWRQSRRLVDVAGYVRSDVEAANREARKQIDEARKMMGEASKGLVAPWDSSLDGGRKD